MAEVTPPHAGLIREDKLLLNYIFGLHQDPCLQTTLQSPVSLLELAGSMIKDVVLAVDTEVVVVPLVVGLSNENELMKIH